MKAEIGPRQLEFNQMTKELALAREKLADLGEELIEAKITLEAYRNAYAALLNKP